ncbi:MAG: DNA starvation/stationary phase protection protein [Chitinophagaceae bacterium]
MKSKIGISEEHKKAVCAVLTNGLANSMMLYTKTRKFHWNVSGNSFMELHKLFEAQYKALEEAVDEIAERIGKLGFKAIGTMAEFTKHAIIKETPGKNPDQKGMISELLNDHESIITVLRKDIDDCDEKYKDAGTTDFLTGIMQQHETIAWTLRRYLD